MLYVMDYTKLTSKKQKLDYLRPFPINFEKNLYEWFRVELTYTSNAIEGNTLTRRETAIVIEEGLTIGGKDLREHLEAKNHALAWDFINTLIKKRPSQLSEKDVFTIHEIILKGIEDENAGCYRNVPVRISGSTVVMPNPRKVPELMDKFFEWITSKHGLHPVAFAGEAHYRFVSIHPFVDGNGRAARLIMNLLLMMHGYPPAIIRKGDRLPYLKALETAQLGGSKTDYEKIIAKAVERSLDIYLKAFKGNRAASKTSGQSVVVENIDSAKLLKIGELAKAAETSVSTIRYWTKEGLLEVVETTNSGYQLYSPEMAQQCKKIKELQEKRLTIREIRMKFLKEEKL
ncbi:MAG: Fic family protein [Oligoflexia bacterium]|nr:Fic family protein [Oligoflexia bacterium]